MSPQTLPEWLPTEEAAAFCNISPRALQRRVKTYPTQIRRKQERTGPRNALVALYSTADLAQFKQRIADGVNPASLEAAPERDARLVLHGPPNGQAALLPALAAVLQSLPSQPKQWKLWLTIEEAAEYSGLPVGYIRNMVEGRELNALNVSRSGLQKRWRIPKRELDALAEAQA